MKNRITNLYHRIITPDVAFWIGFVLGSMIGQVIGTFAFCFFGSAMAPKNNNRVCLILGLLFGLFFMIPIFFGYITFLFVAPYLCCIVGIVLAILYRKRRYSESLNASF